MTTQEILTKENAQNALSIININHPEWGVKRFNFNSQPLNNNKFTHSFGIGVNSAILDENEFKFWAIIAYKN